MACAVILSVAAAAWVLSNGYTLYFGDAEAHLNIARRIIDSRTPGFDQIGTVWLPLPHLLMLPFVVNDAWWRSGLAGAIPSCIAFVVACGFLYASARDIFGGMAAAVTAVAVFALNPNILYLQSIPMTESLFFACLTGLLYTTIWYRRSGSMAAVVLAGVLSNAASLTRYEGWFLIPFITGFLLLVGGKRRWTAAILFGAMAALAPLAWLAHNWYYFGNPIEFYNGPYSAKGIYERALKSGVARYPGDHDWLKAIQYFWMDARLTAGAPVAWLGLVGALIAAMRRRWWTVGLLALTPVFYVMSMHSSGTPIFVPNLWPHSYYNTRYATTMMPLLAIGMAAFVWVSPARWRTIAAVIVVAAAVAPWLMQPRKEAWVCWKESRVNSESRRAWTSLAATYLAPRYHRGEGIFTSFGDLSGIFRQAGIPLRETLHEGNNPYWNVAYVNPRAFLREKWAVAFAGDSVTTAIQRANQRSPAYELVTRVIVPDSQVVEIYYRTGGQDAIPALCRQNLLPDCDEGPPLDPQDLKNDDDENPVHESTRRP